VEQPQVTFAVVGIHCQEHFCSAAISAAVQRVFSLVHSVTARTIITPLEYVWRNLSNV